MERRHLQSRLFAGLFSCMRYRPGHRALAGQRFTGATGEDHWRCRQPRSEMAQAPDGEADSCSGQEGGRTNGVCFTPPYEYDSETIAVVRKTARVGRTLLSAAFDLGSDLRMVGDSRLLKGNVNIDIKSGGQECRSHTGLA